MTVCELFISVEIAKNVANACSQVLSVHVIDIISDFLSYVEGPKCHWLHLKAFLHRNVSDNADYQ